MFLVVSSYEDKFIFTDTLAEKFDIKLVHRSPFDRLVIIILFPT